MQHNSWISKFFSFVFFVETISKCSTIGSSTLGPPPELVSPAADLLGAATRRGGEETALGRAPPGAQRPRDQLRRGVRPLQPRCPRDRGCCPTSPLATLAGDEHHLDTRYSLPLSSLPAVRSRAPKPQRNS
jgi:hypothetical protein